MNALNVQKMAIAFGLLAFGILMIGSIAMGSRVLTGALRGGMGALIFGGLIWGFAHMLVLDDGTDDDQDMAEDDNNPDKGTQLDQSA